MRKFNFASNSLARLVINHKRYALLVVLLLIVTVATAAIVSTKIRTASTSAATLPVGVKADAQHPRPLVRVWVHIDTIQPLTIYARPGKLRLRAENETGRDVSLVVESAPTGTANRMMGKASTKNNGKRADQDLDLVEGEYVFYEESRPEIKGRLIVTSILK